MIVGLPFPYDDPNLNNPCPRSGSFILSTRTVLLGVMLVISCGVINIYCFLSEPWAFSIYNYMSRRSTIRTQTSYHHLHADATIDGVHEHVKLIFMFRQITNTPRESEIHTQTSERTSNGFPERQQQTDS